MLNTNDARAPWAAIAAVAIIVAILASCTQLAETDPLTPDASLDGHGLTIVHAGAGEITSAPEGILCGVDCYGNFPVGSVVTLTANTEDGWYLHDWGAESCGANRSCEFTLVQDTTLHVSLAAADVDLDAGDETLTPGAATTIVADLTGVAAEDLEWQATGGIIEGQGATVAYTAPAEPGTYTVTARVPEFPDLASSVTIRVWAGLREPFTMIMVPDTQNMIKNAETSPLVDAMTAWIVEQRDVLDIDFVTHVGDIVAFADRADEWTRARAAFDVLDGVVPYSMAFGDHEYELEENMGTSVDGYLTNFGPNRYAQYEWYGGSSPGGLSHYQIFEAGGRQFLNIALQWEAPGSTGDPSTPLGWAHQVLEEHPNLPTIITTHAYLWDKPGYEGRFGDRAREGYVMNGSEMEYIGSSGETIWEELVRRHPQVFMVLGGHYHKRPDDHGDNGEYHQVSTNDAGLPVYEMLANYQSWVNGGDGWLRILQFEPGAGADGADRIVVRTYSPAKDEYQEDAGSSFSFELSFAERFGEPTSE